MKRRVKQTVKQTVTRAARRLGYDLVPIRRGKQPFSYPQDFTPEAIAVCAAVEQFTLTRPERLGSLRTAVHYVVDNAIPGAFAEAGVWRGGSMMAVALSLLERGVTDRDLFLFDTYGAIPSPTGPDGDAALTGWNRFMEAGTFTGVEEVRANLASTGYPMERVRLVAGLVEDTIPAQAPAELALLRLDTDYYTSTKHELDHLWPRLAAHGVLLIDDYGHFQGARQAVDEFFSEQGVKPLLQRVDYTCRLVLKAD